MWLLEIDRPETPPFRIAWADPEVGWLDATLIGENRFELSAGCYDPFPDMLDWVRRCCSDRLPQSFVWNTEHVEYLFTYYWQSQYLRVEEIVWNELPKVAWDGFVSLKDLRKNFYLDFMAHVEAIDFPELEWFQISMGEILGRFQDVPAFVRSLVALNRESYEKFWNDFRDLLQSLDWGHCDRSLRGEAFRIEMTKLCDLPNISTYRSMAAACSHRYQAENWDSASSEKRHSIVLDAMEECFGDRSCPDPCYPRILELESELKETPKADAVSEEHSPGSGNAF